MIATDRVRPSGARHRFRAGITDARAWLAAAGLVLYVLLRLAYSTFYQPLGVSPEDLGFGYLDILAQAAIGFVVLVVVFAIASLFLGVEIVALVALLFAFGKQLWSLGRGLAVGWQAGSDIAVRQVIVTRRKAKAVPPSDLQPRRARVALPLDTP